MPRAGGEQKLARLREIFFFAVTSQQSVAASAMPEIRPVVSCCSRHVSAMSEVRFDGDGSP